MSYAQTEIFSFCATSLCILARFLYRFYTSAELNAKAGHLLRQLHLLEVCLLLSYTFPLQRRHVMFWWLEERENNWWHLKNLDLRVMFTWDWLRQKPAFDFLTVLYDRLQQREVQVEIYFAAVDVSVRYATFQYTMSPQRKASAEHTLIFSNQRRGSLDSGMTNSDLTDEESLLTGVPSHRRCMFLPPEIW